MTQTDRSPCKSQVLTNGRKKHIHSKRMGNKGLKIEKFENGEWVSISLEEAHQIISKDYAKGYKNVEQWIYRALEAGATVGRLRLTDHLERYQKFVLEHGEGEFNKMMIGLWFWLNRIHRNDEIEKKGN